MQKKKTTVNYTIFKNGKMKLEKLELDFELDFLDRGEYCKLNVTSDEYSFSLRKDEELFQIKISFKDFSEYLKKLIGIKELQKRAILKINDGNKFLQHDIHILSDDIFQKLIMILESDKKMKLKLLTR